MKNLLCSYLLGVDSFAPPTATDDTDLRKYKQAIKTLQSNPNITIKPVDKGSKIVILDLQQYALEANRQLDNLKYYKQIPNSVQPLTLTLTREIIQGLYMQNRINRIKYDCSPDEEGYQQNRD